MENFPGKQLSAAMWGIFLLLVSQWLKAVTAPLLTGICLALFLDPLRDFSERRLPKGIGRFRRGFSLIIVFAAMTAAAFLLVRYAGERLAESIDEALGLLPSLGRQADAVSREISAQTKLDISSLPAKALESLFSALKEVIDRLFTGGGSAFLGLVFAVWILAGRDKLFALAEELCRRTAQPEKHLKDLALCRRCFSAFVKGQSADAAVLGAGCFVGMALFHKPFAGLISLVIGITALIPAAGAWAGAAFGALLLFSKSTADGVWFLIFIFLLQLLENNLIYPRVMGKTVGMPGGLVLGAVLTGGVLFGIPGMLLFVPAASFLWQKMKTLLP